MKPKWDPTQAHVFVIGSLSSKCLKCFTCILSSKIFANVWMQYVALRSYRALSIYDSISALTCLEQNIYCTWINEKYNAICLI